MYCVWIDNHFQCANEQNSEIVNGDWRCMREDRLKNICSWNVCSINSYSSYPDRRSLNEPKLHCFSFFTFFFLFSFYPVVFYFACARVRLLRLFIFFSSCCCFLLFVELFLFSHSPAPWSYFNCFYKAILLPCTDIQMYTHGRWFSMACRRASRYELSSITAFYAYFL